MTRRTFYIETRYEAPKVNTYVRCWYGIWIVRAIAVLPKAQEFDRVIGHYDVNVGYFVHLEAVNEHRVPFPLPEPNLRLVDELPIPKRECELQELMHLMVEQAHARKRSHTA